MRDKLNSNPMLQAAVIGVLLLGTAFFLLSSMGGGEEEEGETGSTEATVSVAGTGTTGTATGATPGEAVEGAIAAATQGTAAPSSVPPEVLAEAAPPPPREVRTAFEANRTVVLLFVRNSGIDDKLVKSALGALQAFPDVSTFVVPANRIARYSAITQGVEVNRVPALVVIRPKRVGGEIPTASVQYGFQSPESVQQAVIDAGYEGRTIDYHP
jgi:hypothetical protein